MGLRINQNITAMNAYRNLSVTEGQLSKSLERLSSGFRINRAADDAAGLAISEKLRGQVNGLNQASSNAQNGISLVQTAEGALNESHAILQRMRTLAVQSANDTNTDADRGQIQKEVDELAKELNRIGDSAEFNTKKLLDGTASNLTFQIGANQGQTLSVSVGDMRGTALGVATETAAAAGATATGVGSDGALADGSYSVVDNNDGTFSLVDSSSTTVATSSDGQTFTAADSDSDNTNDATYAFDRALTDGEAVTVASGTATVAAVEESVSGVDVSTRSAADTALAAIDSAIQSVSDQRSTLGAVQNRLEHTINNLGVAAENLAASESRIRDTDMAAEMMKFTRAQILSQAGTAMLAQANQVPQGVLQLLR